MKLYRAKDSETAGRAGYKAAYVADIELNAATDTAGVIIVSIPAATKSSPHLHSSVDELFIAMNPVGLAVEGRLLTLDIGDTVLVERGEKHQMEALAEQDGVLIAIKLPNNKIDKIDC